MPARPDPLTAVKVRTAAPGRYGDGNKLYLLVRSAESAWWIFRYTSAGKMREIGLGRARGTSAVTLADAREKAAELYRAVGAGLDPLAERVAKAEAAAAARRAVTFREVAADYIAAHKAG